MKHTALIGLAALLAACGSNPAAEDRATVVEASAPASPRFVTQEQDGRLWVFERDSAAYTEFRESGEPAARWTGPGAGPGGVTLIAPDAETARAFMAARDGFHTELADGRVWVFREGSEALAEFRATGEPARRVTRPAAGPLGMTVMSSSAETITEYLLTKPGFDVRLSDGRAWVFHAGSEGLSEYLAGHEPEKRVTRVQGGGPTLLAYDKETLDAYLVARRGFHTELADGRVWVFREHSPELTEYRAQGEPAERVTWPGRGPGGMTLIGPDAETLDAYLRAGA